MLSEEGDLSLDTGHCVNNCENINPNVDYIHNIKVIGLNSGPTSINHLESVGKLDLMIDHANDFHLKVSETYSKTTAAFLFNTYTADALFKNTRNIESQLDSKLNTEFLNMFQHFGRDFAGSSTNYIAKTADGLPLLYMTKHQMNTGFKIIKAILSLAPERFKHMDSYEINRENAPSWVNLAWSSEDRFKFKNGHSGELTNAIGCNIDGVSAPGYLFSIPIIDGDEIIFKTTIQPDPSTGSDLGSPPKIIPDIVFKVILKITNDY